MGIGHFGRTNFGFVICLDLFGCKLGHWKNGFGICFYFLGFVGCVLGHWTNGFWIFDFWDVVWTRTMSLDERILGF